MRIAIASQLFLIPSTAFSAVVLELDASSLINPTIVGSTRATSNAQGTIVDESDPSTALSNVTFNLSHFDGVTESDSQFFDNNVNNHFEDNSLARWSSNTYRNADGSNLSSTLDALGMRTTGSIEPKALMSINFTQAVEDLVLHFWQIDAGDVFLTSVNGSTTGFSALELSGTLGTVPATGLGPGTQLNAGSGSIRLITDDGSPISSIGLTTAKDGAGTDGWSLFISGASVVPEPSSVTLLLGTICFMAGFRRRKG